MLVRLRLVIRRQSRQSCRQMTPAQFKAKWAKFSGKESSAYQDHFADLCRMLGVPTPIEADPTGNDSFCFQKRVAKDAELFDFDATGEALPASKERGFADVWKRDCFGWEYKGPGEDLEKAYKQLLRYRESLLNPPLLIVCDFQRYIVRTNFNGAVQETHDFTNADIDSPAALRVLRAALAAPDELRPQETTADVTAKLAQKIAAIALSLQQREAVELTSAKTRREHSVAQKKNLRIARFLNRLVFCFFAEDTGLLPEDIFGDVCAIGLKDPKLFAETLEDLFKCMAKGGRFGTHKIRHFNGHLFEDATVFELLPDEIGKLADAAGSKWQSIRPAIMGTLFERALDDSQRSQLGAHYTSEEDIRTLVEPVLMAPLRREWRELRKDLAPLLAKGKATNTARDRLAAFQKKLAGITVLDPACGSGNFLYVALQLLLGLEKEIITAAAQIGFTFSPQVNVQQLRAIEINPYAYELAQVSVQIGALQWRRDNGFDNDRTPVLQNLDGFENKDALLNETFRKKPKDLKAAQAEEHGGQDELFKVYTERAWPACDAIVGNPPFLGGKMLRRELGDKYVAALFENLGGRVRLEADLCCYWFEKARQQIEEKHCLRAGLLATQGIRGGANRDVLKRIKETGGIFFAVSDRDWILAGATVHVSMIGFDDGSETERTLDGVNVAEIHANLSAHASDITEARQLAENLNVAFMGDTKGGAFDITEARALEMMHSPNPHGRPNSDVLIPWVNGLDVTRRSRRMFIIDFGHVGGIAAKNALRGDGVRQNSFPAERVLAVAMPSEPTGVTDPHARPSPPTLSATEEDCAKYEMPFAHVSEQVRPERIGNKRALYARYWWRHVEPRPGMLAALAPLRRFLATARVSKHRLFAWLEAPTLPDSQVFAFALADDFSLGVLHSRIHEAWARAHGTQVRERESGFRYTPTTCFETFPLPTPTPAQSEAIAAAAKELNALRENWLNPPEWTATRTLEFPGSTDGPWSRFVTNPDARGVGTVRYPITEPRDAECATKLAKRTLTNLYNERPAWLDNAHAKLDAAVAAAYGWPADLSDDQILSRLLALNLTRAAEEAKATAPNKPRAVRQKAEDEML
jgi:type II restriction/modification system DNA methylase subunit YeeA